MVILIIRDDSKHTLNVIEWIDLKIMNKMNKNIQL